MLTNFSSRAQKCDQVFFGRRRTPTIRYDNPSLNRHFGKPTSLIVGFGIFAVICDDLISGRQKRGNSGNTCTAIEKLCIMVSIEYVWFGLNKQIFTDFFCAVPKTAEVIEVGIIFSFFIFFQPRTHCVLHV